MGLLRFYNVRINETIYCTTCMISSLVNSQYGRTDYMESLCVRYSAL